MRWRLLLEEFSPEMKHISGGDNIVADSLSRHEIQEEDVKEIYEKEILAVDNTEVQFPMIYPNVREKQKK